ncbi:hypothetical protein M634_22475 [Vibrio parahaemolyticus O1:Kuk str. FDA_R31]|uniref:hypothetical protein n=1 Tax=Vibrio harveyi group TaxID=717610 RepID=UPI000359220E|nr:hypothetical protein [Vibrio parahaemolyticus]AGQ94069.1 hypothetical protein M634_22475 [Vibrio parahaemolyticus O1:Kuk str. FDA_R31]EGR0313595.1 hypothetical protein [Vibrio parahaemolyticus]EJB0394011.1 hypothetical protein [Vibrio parahaemolyticus]EJB5290067.1 hypothetical protein [Vibrio parahaemolyticus]EJG2015367.1 hypothetical protein [Vibrio parahaemolyticus]
MTYEILTEQVEVHRLGIGNISSYPFVVNDTEYVCWLTELTADSESVEDTVREIEFDGHFTAGPNTYKVDFDTRVNFNTMDEDSLFVIPEGGYGNSLLELAAISAAIAHIVDIHQGIHNCIFYFAEPASRSHNAMYERWVIPQLADFGYNYHRIEDDEGCNYVFAKE